MPWSSTHIKKWLVDTGQRFTTACGKEVAIWQLNHEPDEAILSAWAKHFRNHYCRDNEIDKIKKASQTKTQYLNQFKLPSADTSLGRATRAGDFGEILIADYLQWILNCWVPRVRWDRKAVRDESTKGSDVIGFRFDGTKGPSNKDLLACFESKTKFSKSKKNRIQDAINGSAKDHIRIDESLNYIRQRFLDQSLYAEAAKIARFQNPVDHPYQECFGAVTLFSDEHFTDDEISKADSRATEDGAHPKGDKLVLLIIKGKDMMTLVHELYRRAADEA